jgi:uncharacterized protein (DUF1697 family)
MIPRMTRYVGLIRGINVGGHKAVSMEKLRGFMTDSGFADVKTLLQSGNVIFSGPKQTSATLEKQLEVGLEAKLGVTADFMIRTAAEWTKCIESNPFTEMAKSDPGHLVAICLKEKPAAGAVEKLRAAIKGRETVEAVGRDLYAAYVDGIGTSKLTNTVIEKCLATRGTARNWNTVLKIRAVLEAEV